ncbi:MFS transporter [Virgibacillus flavescens]|uniref:MFS transporter n=1 Tax=Virgibacillus flavescens TaxID=1611422 RepID=UPI003D325BED
MSQDNSKVIKIIAVVTALSLLGDSMLYIALPLYWKQVGLDSLWQVGILLSINRFIRLPVNPVVGWIYKKISLKTGLLIAVTIGAVTTLGYGIFSGFIAWVMLRALWGIAWSFFRIGGLSSVAYYADEKHLGKAMGTYNGIYRLGSLFGLLLGGLFVPVIGLQNVAICFGIITLTGVPVTFLTMKKDYAAKMGKSTMNLRVPLVNPSYGRNKIIIICITGFLTALLFQGILTSTLSSVIEYYYGKEFSVLDFVVSAALLSGFLQSVRWVCEPFLGRWIGIKSDGAKGRLPLLISTLILAAFVYWLVSFDMPISFWVTVTLLVLLGATAISTLTDSIALDVSRSSSNGVSYLTFYSIAQDFGAAIGPFISYMIIELESGYSYLYWGGSGVLFYLAVQWAIVAFMENKQAWRSADSNRISS